MVDPTSVLKYSRLAFEQAFSSTLCVARWLLGDFIVRRELERLVYSVCGMQMPMENSQEEMQSSSSRDLVSLVICWQRYHHVFMMHILHHAVLSYVVGML